MEAQNRGDVVIFQDVCQLINKVSRFCHLFTIASHFGTLYKTIKTVSQLCPSFVSDITFALRRHFKVRQVNEVKWSQIWAKEIGFLLHNEDSELPGIWVNGLCYNKRISFPGACMLPFDFKMLHIDRIVPLQLGKITKFAQNFFI